MAVHSKCICKILCEKFQGRIQGAPLEGAIVALFAYLQAELALCAYPPGGALWRPRVLGGAVAPIAPPLNQPLNAS